MVAWRVVRGGRRSNSRCFTGNRGQVGRQQQPWQAGPGAVDSRMPLGGRRPFMRRAFRLRQRA
jgi:hypothetical protein